MPEAVTLPPEVSAGLAAIVEEHAAEDPTATLDSVLRDKDTGNFVAQALVNDGILTNSADNVNPKNALLTTSARAKVGDALLGELLPPEILEQTPDFLKQKLLGCMGTIGIINSKDDEWNLKKQIVAAVDDFNHNFSGGRTPDPGPVVTALVKMLDAPITAMRQMLSVYAIGADSIRDHYAPAGEPENPYSAFNLAFGTELTQDQYEKGLDAPKTFKYGNTQVPIPPESEASQALKAMRDDIPDDVLGAGGKETDPHITLRYGIQSDDTSELATFLAQQKPFEVMLGRLTTFPMGEDGVPLIVTAEARELRLLEKEIDKHGDFIDRTFPEYKPHATVAYIKDEKTAKIISGDQRAMGTLFMVDAIEISKKDGTKERIALGKPAVESKPLSKGDKVTYRTNKGKSALEK